MSYYEKRHRSRNGLQKVDKRLHIPYFTIKIHNGDINRDNITLYDIQSCFAQITAHPLSPLVLQLNSIFLFPLLLCLRVVLVHYLLVLIKITVSQRMQFDVEVGEGEAYCNHAIIHIVTPCEFVINCCPKDAASSKEVFHDYSTIRNRHVFSGFFS